jgi:hypothetical protein
VLSRSQWLQPRRLKRLLLHGLSVKKKCVRQGQRRLVVVVETAVTVAAVEIVVEIVAAVEIVVEIVAAVEIAVDRSKQWQSYV